MNIIQVVQAHMKGVIKIEILEYLSTNIVEALKFQNIEQFFEKLEEIRLRSNKNIILKLSNQELIIDYQVTIKDLLETLEKVTENSIYTYENQISNGFITLHGGHRVGIVGNAILKGENVINISYISGMNFRIARQIKGCANFILKDLYSNGEFQNTLIVGAPGSGKTTLLKDIIRQVSNGNSYGKGLNIGVVDERNEIAAMYKGIAQIDLGLRTDVISNIPKSLGIKMLIRSMSPQVIAVDEIGGKKDAENIFYAMCSGSKGIFTAHGNSISDIKSNPELKELIDAKVIERIVVLDKNFKEKISSLYFLDKEKKEYKKCI